MNLRDTLLRPCEVRPHLLRGLHAIGKVRARGFHAALRELLQFLKFALLGVELAGSGEIWDISSTSLRLDFTGFPFLFLSFALLFCLRIEGSHFLLFFG